MITESFYKMLTIVYEQEGFDANNINTTETTNNYKCYHTYKNYGNTEQENNRWYLSWA